MEGHFGVFNGDLIEAFVFDKGKHIVADGDHAHSQHDTDANNADEIHNSEGDALDTAATFLLYNSSADDARTGFLLKGCSS